MFQFILATFTSYKCEKLPFFRRFRKLVRRYQGRLAGKRIGRIYKLIPMDIEHPCRDLLGQKILKSKSEFIPKYQYYP
jgi:DNA-binding protein Fis